MIAPNQSELVIKARLELAQLQMDKRKLQSMIRDFSLGGLLDTTNFAKDSPYLKELANLETQLATVNQKLFVQQKAVRNIATPFRSISDAVSSTKFTDLNSEIKAESVIRTVNAQKELTSATKLATYELNKQVKVLKKQRDDLTRQPAFAGYAMSIMFAGMALQRTFTQLQKFGTKTFNEISHSVEGTVTQSDILDGSMKYLGYTIGEALEPVIEWIIPIIDSITEWTEENPKLVATITTLGVVLGTLFAVGGAGKLALDGFDGLGKVLKQLNSSKLSGGIFGLSISAGWIVAILAVAAAFLSINEAMNKSPLFKKNTEEMLGTLSTAFGDLFKVLDDLVKEIFGTGIWDTAMGTFLILGRIVMQVLIPAFTALLETGVALSKVFLAFAKAVKGDFKGAGDTLKSISFELSKQSIAKAEKDSQAMWGAIMKTGLSFQGQLDFMKQQKNIEDSTKRSSAYGESLFTAKPYSQPPISVNINNMYVEDSRSRSAFDGAVTRYIPNAMVLK